VPSGTSSWSSDTFYTNEPGTVYASNAFCTFTIQNPMRRTLYVSFAIFRTEDCCDNLYVAIDGPASQRVASNMGPIVGARSISFTFRSDGSVASNGVAFSLSTQNNAAPSPSATPRPPYPADNDDNYSLDPPPGCTDSLCRFSPNASKYAAGAAGSVIVSLALSACVLATAFCVRPSPPATALAKMWQSKATRAFPLMIAAHCMLMMGTLTSIASLSIVYASIDGRTYRGRILLNILAVPAAFSFISLICLLFPGVVLSGVAAVQLRRLAVGGVMPERSCCAPSAPAIQGLSWAGTSFYLVLGLTTRTLIFSGLALDVFSVICLLIGCVLTSVVGCCAMGALPGLGAGRENSCCVEPVKEGLEAEQATIDASALQFATLHVAGAAAAPQMQMRAPAEWAGRGGGEWAQGLPPAHPGLDAPLPLAPPGLAAPGPAVLSSAANPLSVPYAASQPQFTWSACVSSALLANRARSLTLNPIHALSPQPKVAGGAAAAAAAAAVSVGAAACLLRPCGAAAAAITAAGAAASAAGASPYAAAAAATTAAAAG
jgi:hypothetical protein